jgi:hypothetical protein
MSCYTFKKVPKCGHNFQINRFGRFPHLVDFDSVGRGENVFGRHGHRHFKTFFLSPVYTNSQKRSVFLHPSTKDWNILPNCLYVLFFKKTDLFIRLKGFLPDSQFQLND